MYDEYIYDIDDDDEEERKPRKKEEMMIDMLVRWKIMQKCKKQ